MDAAPPSAAPLAITQGDACGIGPEIAARLFDTPESAGCFVVGDVAVMRRAAAIAGGMRTVARLDAPHDAAQAPRGCIPVWQPPGLPPDLAAAPIGRVDRRAGAAAALCIEQAAALALRREVAGIVTAPIHKEALAAAGVPFPGHTEMLQSLAAVEGRLPPVRMMLANDELRTVLVTIHLSLRRAIDAVTFDAVLDTLRIAHAAAASWGQPAPRIAVAGLNPHAGEGGLFGDEEIRIIRPAIEAARAEGIDASGPWPGDTVYMQARSGLFDVVVAQYHDQGLIPVKYLGLTKGVNITLGLPFVRTSPDHGTAFDIAGQGIADPASLETAFAYARRLVG